MLRPPPAGSKYQIGQIRCILSTDHLVSFFCLVSTVLPVHYNVIDFRAPCLLFNQTNHASHQNCRKDDMKPKPKVQHCTLLHKQKDLILVRERPFNIYEGQKTVYRKHFFLAYRRSKLIFLNLSKHVMHHLLPITGQKDFFFHKISETSFFSSILLPTLLV